MNFKMMTLDELKPFDRNPRFNDHAVDLVANSIQSFGFLNPIIVNKENVICAGHTRFKAARKLNLKEVPVIVVDMEPKTFMAYNIADNKTGELAQWNYDELSKIVNDLMAEDTDIIKNLGFDDKELKAICEKFAADSEKSLQDLIVKDENIWSPFNFIIKCENQAEMAELQTMLDTDKEKLEFKTFKEVFLLVSKNGDN